MTNSEKESTSREERIVSSLLDTDLYKITMHAAVHKHYPTAVVEYKYTNRTTAMKFNNKAALWIEREINYLGDLRFEPDEIEYLGRAVPYLPTAYYDYLSTFQLRPKQQIKVTFSDVDDLDISIAGLWIDTILYEIPILAIVSEAYFRFIDTDWNYDNQIENAESKIIKLLNDDCVVSEFGTRRRRSVETQELVIEGLLKGSKETKNPQLFTGTSNVMFAKKFNIKPIGTVAHEWFMGIAGATDDYINANKLAMQYWIDTVGAENSGVALTDTFGTEAFLRVFRPPFTDIYAGVRQDSGDPEKYTELLGHHYFEELGYQKGTKTIVFSDSLNVEKCIKYKAKADAIGFKTSFGVGTFFSNDFNHLTSPYTKSTPLNIVIKLKSINGKPAIKISDNLGKNMGDPKVVQKVKADLGYVEKTWKDGDEAHRW